jgi:DNA (cytosine-5)-methyltransferase 1
VNHLDLFSGIGGFALAASWVWGKEHNIVSFVEIEPFCQKVLNKHWPDVPIHDDIRSYKHNGTNVDLLTGGFPCQPVSVAGKQRGKKDDRWLWPEMLRVIREVRPRWVIGENVAGIINMELDTVLSQLEDEDYTTETFIIPACAVDAPHRRDRVWIVAHSKFRRLQTGYKMQTGEKARNGISKARSYDVSDAEELHSNDGEHNNRSYKKSRGQVFEFGNKGSNRGTAMWLPEPSVGRVAHGIPQRVDRLKSLGNAIVPQTVVPIMQCIKAIEKCQKPNDAQTGTT